MIVERLLAYFYTLRHLKPTQWWYQCVRRMQPLSLASSLPRHVSLRQNIHLRHSFVRQPSSCDGMKFMFLNRAIEVQPHGMDWLCHDMSKLWRYNLHYFDYLQDVQRSVESKSHLITDWIEHNPPGTEDAWEPYTASLRIVNWVKFFVSQSVVSVEKREEVTGNSQELMRRAPTSEWLKSLYQQALWLEHNIEYHILANHYLKNGVALFFAGMFFEGVDADRWIKKGLKILREELEEQFLDDGGHYERSPMYHSICVSDYLDVLNLAQNSHAATSLTETTQFRERITTSLNFLNNLCLPDKEIALFNDSAFGIAPTPGQIFEYAGRVIGYEPPVRPTGLAIFEQSESGYYGCRKGEDMIIIDCGVIGPNYQPGHAHCDTLSYELAINGRRVIVDSGVFDYEASEERAYARSTRAHNTVVVDGEEQSEMWGVFRVARRAKPLGAFCKRQVDGSVIFEGAHDGYARLTGRPIHKRHVSYDGQGTWVIKDALEGKGIHRMDSYIHIHPDFEAIQSEAGIRVSEPSGSTMAIVEALGPIQMRMEQGWYFPEFGLKRKNHVIVFSCSGKIPLGLSYRIQKVVSRNQ